MNRISQISRESLKPVAFAALAGGVLAGAGWLVSRWLDAPLFGHPLGSLPAAGLLAFALTRPERQRLPAALGVALAWFSLQLADTWGSLLTEGYLIAGLFPFSDAGAYFQEAARLIEGRDFSSWGSRRPLAGFYLSGWLGLSSESLRLSLFMMNAAAAACLALVATELRRHVGAVAAALFAWVVFLFYRRFCGVFSSEVGGVTWGLLSLWLLLRALRTRHLVTALLGLAALSLASNIRAGALLVLPLLFLWLAWEFRACRRRLLVLVLGGGLALSAGFTASGIATSTVGAKDGVLFANYAQTLYGVVFDGDWTKSYTDHPVINSMSERERTGYLYGLIWTEIKNNPASLARGLARGWIEFLTRPHSGLSPFDFIRHLPAELAVYLLGFLGALAALYRCRADWLARLVVVGNAGIFLSVALVPTRDADNMRIYAATVPWLALLPCGLMVAWTSRHRQEPPAPETAPALGSARPALGLFATMAGALILLPLFFRFVSPQTPSVRFVEEDVLDLQPRRASQLVIEAHDSAGGAAADRITAGLTTWTTENYPGLPSILRTYDRPGVMLVSGTSSSAGLLILDAKHATSEGHVRVKGTWVRPIAGYSPFFVEASLLPVAEAP